MKILLDENLPHRLRNDLPGHEVHTVFYAGWVGVKNGKLLALAESEGFEILLTADQNLSYQQSLKGRSIAVVCLTALRWDLIEPHLSAIVAALDSSTPGSFQIVECGRFRPGK